MKVILFQEADLSEKAILRYAELKGITLYKREPYPGCTYYYSKPPNDDGSFDWGSEICRNHIDRIDPIWVQVIEELGDEACESSYGEIRIETVEPGSKVRINNENYDGDQSTDWIEYYNEEDWYIAD